jgi:outer membrane protein assembly factor BamB
VYAAGYINGTGTYDFGNGKTAAGTNTNGINMVLVKYDSSGVAQWARTVTAGSNESLFSSVSVTSDGSVYAAGYIVGTGTYNFGDNATASGTNSGENIILVKYDISGTAQWAQTMIAGTGSSVFNGVSVASDGSVYAAGQIYGAGAYDLGNGMTAAGTNSTGENILLVKYH